VTEQTERQLPVTVEVKLLVQCHPGDIEPTAYLLNDNSILIDIGVDPLMVKFLECDGDPNEYQRAQHHIAAAIYSLFNNWHDESSPDDD
jgi:hypothetical protein